MKKASEVKVTLSPDEELMVSGCCKCKKLGKFDIGNYSQMAAKLGWFPSCRSELRESQKCPCQAEFTMLMQNGICLLYKQAGRFVTWKGDTKYAVSFPMIGYLLCNCGPRTGLVVSLAYDDENEACLWQGHAKRVPLVSLKRHDDFQSALNAYLEMRKVALKKSDLRLDLDWRKHTPEELTKYSACELLSYYEKPEFKNLLRSLIEGVLCRSKGKESWPLSIKPSGKDPDRVFPYYEIDKRIHVAKLNNLASLWERIDMSIKPKSEFDAELLVICKKDGQELKKGVTESGIPVVGAIPAIWDGMDFASSFHKQMFDVPVDNGVPPIKVFKNVALFEKLCFKAFTKGNIKNGKITKNGVRKVFGTANSLKVVRNGCRSTKNFQPSAALLIYKYFGAQGRALDPSAGFSGRLIGALCSKISEYVGVDPEEAQIKGGEACRETFRSWYPDLKEISEYNKALPEARLVQAPFEEVSEQDVPDNSFDVAFTSPPYFGFEEYNKDNPDQSTTKYSSSESWVNEFLPAYVKRAYKALKPDGWYLVNVANVSGARDLEGATKAACKKVFGTDPLFTLGLELPRPPAAHKSGKTDKKLHPVFVYRKGILAAYSSSDKMQFLSQLLAMPPGQTVVERPLMSDPKN